MAKAPEDMTTAELERENQKLMADKEAIREKQRNINEMLTRRTNLAGMTRLTQNLTQDQKAVLHRVIQAKGIPSEEQMGTP